MPKTFPNSKSTTVNLTDAQAAMLKAAARREDRCLTPASSMRAAQVVKIGEKLISAGLVREMKARGSIPVWRRDSETGAVLALELTAAGVKATVFEGELLSNKAAASVKVEASPVTAISSCAPVANIAHDKAVPAATEQRERDEPRRGSKISAVIGLLSRPGGATLGDLIAATGWLPHTTRAALTGLRKRGYVVTLARSDRDRSSSYAITSKLADGASAAKERMERVAEVE